MGGPAAADPGLRKDGGHYYTKGSRHLGVYTSVEREREEERAPSTCERRGGGLCTYVRLLWKGSY